MRLTLIRHAQPDWIQGGKMVGNPALTELGRRQTVQLAARPWFEVDELWVSELRRARETAAPLAAALGLEPRVFKWMNEIGDPAEWDGMSQEQVDARIAEFYDQPTIDKLWKGVRRGEAYRSFQKRVTDGLTATLGRYGTETMRASQHRLWRVRSRKSIVLVAHGGTNGVIYENLLGCGATPIAWHKFRSLHTAVSVLESYPLADSWMFSLRSFGDVTHLSPEQVTG
ncbi:MAG: histidine phosphatase family protein [Acidimicrobiia bacterium]|nr:histidine phosphatase family protein [bacterium]MXX02036.1 histidine phosphatase family protein [Acidimicrobiia bacterium]MDE0675134.1 histidine phosphatase family protein [bacterium]MXX45019.1 histidine phosphatase family protein [Acidimicrobiia bacterium]MXY74660.1 histidine phosphatase family protein [Acidimicrobiia bacterium]